MRRIGRTSGALAAAMVCLMVAACGGTSTGGSEPAEEDFQTQLQMGTGSTGGTYYPLGGEMATMLSETIDTDGFGVSAVETGASAENMAKIGSGDLQLGMTINGTAIAAYEGEGPFEGKQIENFGYITQIYPEVLHVVTREATGVDSIEDLEGKKVAIGPPGSGTNIVARQVLAAHGLEEGDYDAYQEDFGVASTKLQDGNIAASIAILGSPAAGIDQLQATTNDVRYLEIDGEALKKLEADTAYGAYKIPTDAYSWLDEDVSTLAARAVLVASTNQVSEDIAYEITKSLVENSDQISHQQAKHMTAENALVGQEGLPLHPGAEKYYTEEGLLD